MPMGDDLAAHSLELTTNASKMALEILRYLADFMKQFHQNQKYSKSGKDDIDNKIYKGKLTDKKFAKYANANGGFKQQGNISKDDIPTIIQEAKMMGIPINIRETGNGQCSVCYLNRDSELFQTCLQNVVASKLAVKDTDYIGFNVKEHEIAPLQAEFAEHGVSASFVETKDGSMKCVFEARDKSIVDKIKDDYRSKHSNISENFNISFDEKKRSFKLSDETTGKTITVKRLPTEAKLETILQEQFGFDKTSATIGCKKFEGVLSEKQKEFFRTDTRQIEKIANYERNIRLDKENPLLSDFSFSRIKTRSDNHNYFAVSNGDHVVCLCPDMMSRRDMEEIVKSKLGITDRATIEAVVDKASIANSKYKEQNRKIKKDIYNVADKSDITDPNKGKYNIERISADKFDVTKDGVTKTYSFYNAKEQLMAEGISAKKAGEIISKAKRQSAAHNMVKNLEKQGFMTEKGPEIKNPKMEFSKPKAGAR